MKHIFFLLLFLSGFSNLAQTDAELIKTIYNTSLTDGHSYQWLDHLSNQIGGRLSGSLNAQRAVEYTRDQLDSIGLD
ncbi:MAG: peptidase M28 family protein, partial [Bacteroidia bacterium]|nr:peptidase M28 family protein [Bacteroidia bacterium]